ncbi:MAG TPA: HEAT repeat domain-containing protein [Gemmataceae bacterium]|nr:HEAT repeat domain-containing protein [Gemmataceae bacterium]
MRRLLLIALAALLCGCGGKSTNDLVEQLHARDSADRLHAIRALETRGSEADVVVPALAEALRDHDVFVRRDAALALGRLGPEAQQAVPYLVPVLRDRDRAVRKASAQALKKIDPQAATRAGVR